MDNHGMFAAARICCIDSAFATTMSDQEWAMLARRAEYTGHVTDEMKAEVIGYLREIEQDAALRKARSYFFGHAA